jgi:hypothetical protein
MITSQVIALQIVSKVTRESQQGILIIISSKNFSEAVNPAGI